MRKNLLFLSAAIIASLTFCTKESTLDSSIIDAINSQTPIDFSVYASSAASTKGAAINSNADFQGTSFDVAALTSDCTWELMYEYSGGPIDFDATLVYPSAGDAAKYFGLSKVSYSSDSWQNVSSMYWPNSSKVIHFAAYSPSGLITNEEDYTFTHNTVSNDPDDASDYTVTYKYSFDYTVDADISKQQDLMYAMTSVDYIAPSDRKKENGMSYITSGAGETNDEEDVNLHFKHALTQIAFTATKDADIDVFVKGITICNIYNSGTFTATSVTDDSEASSSNPTIGDNDGDKVNADNFGKWVVDYEGTWALVGVDSTTDVSTLSGEYTADTGGYSAMSNYAATMDGLSDTSHAGDAAIEITSSETATLLTSSDDVLMLLPQTLTAWVPTTSTSLNYVGSYRAEFPDGKLYDAEDGTELYANPSMNDSSRTLSYLAIDCEFYHKGYTEPIHDGLIFVPFETSQIDYSKATVDSPVNTPQDAWLAGYKITYCLNFGGGYVVEEGDHNTIPEPGCIPDTKTYTLRPVTYTTTVDAYVPVSDN